MTSKEALENWYNTQSPNTKAYEYEQHYRIIKKDLEVLEMLRPHLINAGIGMFDNVVDNDIFHLKVNLSGKEYKQIEEWLNDK